MEGNEVAIYGREKRVNEEIGTGGTE